MKRLHVSLSVEDLGASVRFYTQVFASEPTVRKDDYAKWLLDVPRVNFAISRRGRPPGLDHLGIQVDSADELAAMAERLRRADHALVEQPGAACCYAYSDKYWIRDPSGVAWETFHTLADSPVYGADTDLRPRSATRCQPVVAAGSAPCCTPVADDPPCCA